jgi:hypothetical protein
VGGAGIAKPEVLAPARPSPVALECDAILGRKSFSKEQLAFAKGEEGH